MNKVEQTSECAWVQEAILLVRDEPLDAADLQKLRDHLEICNSCRYEQVLEERISQALKERFEPVDLGCLNHKVRRRLRVRALQNAATTAVCAVSVFFFAGLLLWARAIVPWNDSGADVAANQLPSPKQKEMRKDRPSMLAALGQSPPVVDLQIVDRHRDALAIVVEDFLKEQ